MPKASLSAVIFERLTGSRLELLPLFQEADDSRAEIDTYLEAGEVLVARHGEDIIGHIQLISRGLDFEIKSIAVIEKERGRGIGTALVNAAIQEALSANARRILVATATADIGNLRFYQRLGFRMDRIERDAFSVERGYLATTDGIAIRDRVWFVLDAKAISDPVVNNL
jgi:GNAT superfamily N-acetyltransferase